MKCEIGTQARIYLLSLLLIACAGLCLVSSCTEDIEVTPVNGSVMVGEFELAARWNSAFERTTFAASLNNTVITDQFSVDNGFAQATAKPLPGRKLFSAAILDAHSIPHGATSIFTATSEYSRETISAGWLTFTCESSFINSPIQIPGLLLDAGFTEEVCSLLSISGIFPSGSATFPNDSIIPVLYGIFPKGVTFDVDPTVPNGISVSPVEIGLQLPFDADDPNAEGAICYFGFEMHGSILPVQEAIPGEIHAAMIQTLNKVSLSTVQEAECKALFTSPESADLITFNYSAKK